MFQNQQKKLLIILAFGLWIFARPAFAADTGILTVTKIGSGNISSVGLYSPTLSGSTLGSVGSIDGIDCGSDCSEEYSKFDTVTLVATPVAPNVIFKWTGCSVSESDPYTCSVTILGNVAVSAQFALHPGSHTLTIKKSDGGTVSGAGLTCGTDCYLTVVSLFRRFDFTAAPDPGYSFTGWSGDTALCGNSSVCRLVVDPGTGTDQGYPLADIAEANFGAFSCSAVKNVTASFITPDVPTCDLTATPVPPIIASGDSATLNWFSSNASSASFDQDIGDVPTNGSRLVYPDNTTTYTLTVNDASGNSKLCSITVTVGAPPAAPPGGKFILDRLKEILPF